MGVNNLTLALPGARRSDAGTVARSRGGTAGLVAVAATAGTKVVGSDVVTLLLFTHWTTEHGTKLVVALLVMVSTNAALPARMLVGDNEPDPRTGGGRFAVGVEMVNCNVFDVPAELDTETAAVAFKAVSEGKIVADS